ncbi:MAG: NAD(P)H-hydrate dehydratase [Nanoarchaeota archaeon]|nr:NAD(P)H-hydrate dehydratase [Nanoarchaeota archaeon]MBU1135876.1 NAD(P)H-hydrate dehydratase [Nanoarchaeota archaeon]MBU2520046.1 NAD(P)H-hydrate dehydratase [Nanoarchaeota archaeon]
MREVNLTFVKSLYKKRDLWCHKGDFGKLLIIGGNKKYSGSPALAAMAAYRAGVDLVTVAAPRRVADIIASFSPNIITYPLTGDVLSTTHLKTLLELTNSADAVVIGGGLGTEQPTIKLIQSFLAKTEKPCVLDADALHAVANNKKLIKKNFILTPHVKEFFTLTGKNLHKSTMQEKEEITEDHALKLGATIILKGHIDIISGSKGTTINNTGSVYMTKGGTGDTLAGICGALLARGVDSEDAAAAAAYINGSAGALAAREYGEGMLATDLLERIPSVIK